MHDFHATLDRTYPRSLPPNLRESALTASPARVKEDDVTDVSRVQLTPRHTIHVLTFARSRRAADLRSFICAPSQPPPSSRSAWPCRRSTPPARSKASSCSIPASPTPTPSRRSTLSRPSTQRSRSASSATARRA
ncbi:hypothetical protein BOS5A_230442 [Bosea sp. EC-HK365B]|nr:hypothetical protein BOSE21B_90519 [Bosea sp. 21B]VVT61165.1 hypothetical protein BOS5A_230442 [Bosea sp. EC-HK365B]